MGARLVQTLIVTTISPVFDGELTPDAESKMLLEMSAEIVPLAIRSVIEEYTPCETAVVTHMSSAFVPVHDLQEAAL